MRSFALILPLMLMGCVEESLDNGRQAFLENCAVCHGADGQGNGPGAAGLDPMPPDLTRIAARNGGIFPRNQVASTIDGLERGAHSTSAMPEFGAGDLGPLVMMDENGVPVPIPADLLALTDYLESIQR